MYEVYQDHPKQAKLNVRVVLAIAFLICAIGAGIFLITRLVSKPLTKEEARATLAHEKVNSNKFGFQISLGNGEKKLTDSKNASKQTLLDSAVEGCYMSGVGDTSANSIGISYDAIVTPVSEAVTNTAIASVLFIIAWDAV